MSAARGAAAEQVGVGDPVEDRRPDREREAREQRAARAADAERHREREPEQPDVGRRAGVAETEAVHPEQHAAEAGDGGRQGEDQDLGAVRRHAGRLGRDLGAPYGEHRATRRGTLQRVDHEGDDAEEHEEDEDLVGELREVDLRLVALRSGGRGASSGPRCRSWACGSSTRADPCPPRRSRRERRRARTRTPRSRARGEHRRAGSMARRRRLRAPLRPAFPSTSAHTKLIWPCVAMPGMSTPQSRLSAQPAANPPAVANDACMRLTIPPMPVTTTNDRKMIPITSACAITVWS